MIARDIRIAMGPVSGTYGWWSSNHARLSPLFTGLVGRLPANGAPGIRRFSWRVAPATSIVVGSY